MSTATTIAKNTVFLSVGDMATRILSLLLIIIIARSLGDIGLGMYSFAFAFTDILLQVIDLGIPTYIMREIAKDRPSGRQYLSNVLGLRLLLVLAIIIAGLSFAVIVHATPETKIVVLLATLGMTFNFLTDPFRAVFLAHEKAAYYAGLILLERSVFTITGLALLLTGHGLIPVIGMYAASQLISFLITSHIVKRKFATFRISFDTVFIKPMVKSSVWFWATNVLRMVYMRADTLLLSAIHGFAATGGYGAAYRIMEAFQFIPLAVVTAVFPALSHMHAKSRELSKLLYKKTFYYMLIIAFPLATGVMLIADKAIILFYGPGFQQSIMPLQLLIWAEAFLFMHLLMGYLLNAINKQHLFTGITLGYVLLNVALNLMMIPKYSFIGAGIAAVVSQAAAAAALFYFCTKNGYGLNLAGLIYKPAIATAAMAGLLIALRNASLFLMVPAAALLYFGIMLAIQGIGKEDLDLVKNTIKGR